VTWANSRKNLPEQWWPHVGIDVSSALLTIGIFDALDLRSVNCGLRRCAEEITEIYGCKKIIAFNFRQLSRHHSIY